MEHEISHQQHQFNEDDLDLDSSSPIGIPDVDIAILADPDNFTKRELRPQKGGYHPTTWLDNDETGNYDPEEERRIVKRARVRPQTRSRHTCGEGKEKVAFEKPKLMVALTFKTAEGRKSFTDLDSKWKARDVAGYKLRARIQEDGSDVPKLDIDLTAKPFARGCWQCTTLTSSVDGADCSLMHDERDWPCRTCKEDGHDCDMVREPARKRSCEQCKSRRMTCSFSYTRNHEGCCLQCQSIGQPCLAGPDVRYIKQRIRLDRDWEVDPMPTKKKGKLRAVEDCYECHKVGRQCHYECEDDGSPCEACKKNGDPCHIGQDEPPKINPPSKNKKRKRAAENEAKPVDDKKKDIAPGQKENPVVVEEEPLARYPNTLKMPMTCNPHASNAYREPHAETSKRPLPNGLPPQRPQYPRNTPFHQQPQPQHPRGSKGVLRKLTTNFCHPMQFNCDELDATNPTPQSCHFCDNTTRHIAIFGLGLARVTVIDFEDTSSQYLELHSGHKARGIAPTRLCTECTTDRLEILLCPGHNMLPIPRTRFSENTMKRAMDELCQGNMLALHAYCALCANLAQYECSHVHEDGEGCGLRLCEVCTLTMDEVHGNDLGDMLARVNVVPTERASIGLRADAELLMRRPGCLMRFMESMRD